MTRQEQLEVYRGMLKTDNRWAGRALTVLWERQTAGEQAAWVTTEHNAQGFSAWDAELGSSLAVQLRDHGWLTERQWRAAHRMLPKYAGQMMAVAAERAAIKSEGV